MTRIVKTDNRTIIVMQEIKFWVKDVIAPIFQAILNVLIKIN